MRFSSCFVRALFVYLEFVVVFLSYLNTILSHLWPQAIHLAGVFFVLIIWSAVSFLLKQKKLPNPFQLIKPLYDTCKDIECLLEQQISTEYVYPNKYAIMATFTNCADRSALFSLLLIPFFYCRKLYIWQFCTQDRYPVLKTWVRNYYSTQ